MLARVAYKEGGQPDGKGGVYGPSNEIKAYKPITSGITNGQSATAQPAYQPAAPAMQPPPAQGQAPAAGAGNPPWMGRAA
jgi:hypothetical protein